MNKNDVLDRIIVILLIYEIMAALISFLCVIGRISPNGLTDLWMILSFFTIIIPIVPFVLLILSIGAKKYIVSLLDILLVPIVFYGFSNFLGNGLESLHSLGFIVVNFL